MGHTLEWPSLPMRLSTRDFPLLQFSVIWRRRGAPRPRSDTDRMTIKRVEPLSNGTGAGGAVRLVARPAGSQTPGRAAANNVLQPSLRPRDPIHKP